MIVLDAPAQRGWYHGPSSHLISDLAGGPGSAELAAFAARLGLNPKWLQEAGSPKEHYDLTKRRAALAVEFGARMLERVDFVAVLLAKRTAMAATEAA